MFFQYNICELWLHCTIQVHMHSSFMLS